MSPVIKKLVQINKMWERYQKTSRFKTASNPFKSKTWKSVGTLFPRLPAPLRPRL